MADFRLRIQFAKKDAALWLSHLELVRAMERLIRRSGLPYAISQGFSPHLKHSFSAALPVGTGSLCEYMDVELTCLVDPDKALQALQAVEVKGLPVLSAGYAAKEEPSLQVYFNLAQYCVRLDDPNGQIAQALFKKLKTTQGIELVKKGKPKQYDLSQYLDPASLTCEGATLSLALLSRPEGSLRPEVVLSTLYDTDAPLPLLSITRTALDHREL